MRVVVDQMPEKPEDCEYSRYRNEVSIYTRQFEEVYKCEKNLNTCSDTSKCPYFVGINDLKER